MRDGCNGPQASWSTMEQAVQYAKTQAENTGYEYYVVKFIDTHLIKPPVIPEATVKEL